MLSAAGGSLSNIMASHSSESDQTNAEKAEQAYRDLLHSSLSASHFSVHPDPHLTSPFILIHISLPHSSLPLEHREHTNLPSSLACEYHHSLLNVCDITAGLQASGACRTWGLCLRGACRDACREAFGALWCYTWILEHTA
eukprot:3424433-Rhodomonas_salina.1